MTVQLRVPHKNVTLPRIIPIFMTFVVVGAVAGRRKKRYEQCGKNLQEYYRRETKQVKVIQEVFMIHSILNVNVFERYASNIRFHYRAVSLKGECIMVGSKQNVVGDRRLDRIKRNLEKQGTELERMENIIKLHIKGPLNKQLPVDEEGDRTNII